LSPLDQELGVVTDCLNRATFHGFLAKSLLLGSLGLLEDIGMTAVIVTLEIGGSSLAAQVAIDALVIAVVSARNILGILVGYISHSERLKARFMIATVFSRYVAKTALLVKIITR
jgi:hypothetical protein